MTAKKLANKFFPILTRLELVIKTRNLIFLFNKITSSNKAKSQKNLYVCTSLLACLCIHNNFQVCLQSLFLFRLKLAAAFYFSNLNFLLMFLSTKLFYWHLKNKFIALRLFLKKIKCIHHLLANFTISQFPMQSPN